MNRIVNVNTAANGTDWTALSSDATQSSDLIRLHNNSTTSIDYRVNGAGSEVTIPAGEVRMIYGIYQPSKVEVRRTDTSVTQVEVQAEIILF